LSLVEASLSAVRRVVDAVKGQERWRGGQTLNLIASENRMSPLARALLVSDFNHRYAEGDPYEREYQGSRFIDEVEDLCVKLSSELFKARFVDVRPISGAIANLAVYYALMRPGERLMRLSIPAGGHISSDEMGAAGCRGVKAHDIPFSHEDMNVDLDRMAELVDKVRPRLVTLGGSLMLFPHPVREVKRMVEPYGGLVHYDAAHVLGLMAGGVFQDPLREGADVVTTSTHKTFPGPQGGMVMSDDEGLFRRVKRAIFPGLVSNHHLARLPCLAVTLLEMKVYGEEYARQVVRNAKALAKAMYEHGFKVLCPHKGFTESHQVAVDVSELGGGAMVARMFEEADIIVNRNLLPWDPLERAQNPSGIRMGTQEVTRMGMREGEMEVIAELMWRLVRGEDPGRVRAEVHRLVSEFSSVKYCFDDRGLVEELLDLIHGLLKPPPHVLDKPTS